jgi:hypothetical protein
MRRQPLHRWILERIGTTVMITTLVAVATPAAAPAATRVVADPALLMPAPFNVEDRAQADLDNDGDADVILVGVDGPVPAPEANNGESDGNRILVVARKDPGGYRRVGVGRDALLCRACGGAFWGGAPAPVELGGAANTLVVKQSAGARELTDWTHRYRITGGRVRLIGVDIERTDRASGSGVTTSTNLLTGVTITTVEGTPEQPATPGTRRGKPRVIYLEAVKLT